jgi:MFS family permease
VLYGIGAIVGPLLTGHLADRAGFGPALRVAFLVEAIAVALPAISAAPAALIVSSVIVGGFTPGIVPLVFGRVHELVPQKPAGQRSAWAQATTSFALFQAAGAYGVSYCFERTGGDYAILFVIGASAAIAALAINLIAAVLNQPAHCHGLRQGSEPIHAGGSHECRAIRRAASQAAPGRRGLACSHKSMTTSPSGCEQQISTLPSNGASTGYGR